MCSVPWSLEVGAAIKCIFSRSIAISKRMPKIEKNPEKGLLQFKTKGQKVLRVKALKGNYSLKYQEMAFFLCKLLEAKYHSNLLT